MLRIMLLISFALFTCALAGCSNNSSQETMTATDSESIALGSSQRQDDDDADDDDSDDEQEIPLSEVPENVIAAATAAVDGIIFEEAARETENGVVVYCLEGEAGGQEYEVEVSADGTVLEVEADDENDDDDDDDDPDNDD